MDRHARKSERGSTSGGYRFGCAVGFMFEAIAGTADCEPGFALHLSRRSGTLRA
jgi:hypothetical protein